MTATTSTPADAATLQDIASRSGYPYPQLASAVASCVVRDAAGGIILGAAAFLSPQAYLYSGDAPAAIRLQALRLIHAEMAKQLKALGYNECDAEIPPAIAGRFGKRLQSLGWIENTWRKWFIRF